ncbi:MAG: hypothetical protein M0Q91_11855 [Methanoregula sp.]|jgi:hypothetical protein|nr:hypothetical protein [Methanoregula sp.]
MNERKIIRRLIRKYPRIADEIIPQKKTNLSGYFSDYVTMTGTQPQWISNNTRSESCQWDEPRTVFVAVMIKLIDPLYFSDNETVEHGFNKQMAELLGCNQSQILYTLRKARNFMSVYPAFEKKVNDIVTKIVRE